MILEKLKLIKSFGTSLDSAVAEADIAAKEKELGFPLPEALREVYLTFSPEDPIFSTWMNLIPLDELRTIVLEDRDKHGAVLPFFRNDTWLCSALAGSFLWKKLETQVLFYDVDLMTRQCSCPIGSQSPKRKRNFSRCSPGTISAMKPKIPCPYG